MKKIFLFLFLFIIILFFFHFNYKSKNNLNIYSEIAVPIFDISFNDIKEINNNNLIAENIIYIKNHKNNILSDISFEYFLYLEYPTDLLKINLYLNSKKISFNNFYSEKIILNNSKKENHEIKIKINYIGNFEKNYSNKLKLKIFAKQIY